MSSIVKTAVFPVAGLGTRFLPATKAIPKELLPIIDRPLIQLAVEEAVEAGIETLVFVTGKSKRAIEDHFDQNRSLERLLHDQEKHNELSAVRSIVPERVNAIFVRQAEPIGLGDAILRAEPIVKRDPFAVILADDHFFGDKLPTKQLIAAFAMHQTSTIALKQVDRSEVSKYGMVKLGSSDDSGFIRVLGVTEKPDSFETPSLFASLGRYVFGSEILDALKCAPGEKWRDPTCGCDRCLRKDAEGPRYGCGS